MMAYPKCEAADPSALHAHKLFYGLEKVRCFRMRRLLGFWHRFKGKKRPRQIEFVDMLAKDPGRVPISRIAARFP
jgi:hypothetical protein